MSSAVAASRVGFSLRPKTPESGKDYDFNKDRFNYWVDRQVHITEDVRDALKELGEKVRRVSYPEFAGTLASCLERLPTGCLERATILGSAHKSNQWVAELACSFLRLSGLKYEELGHERALAITSSLRATSPRSWSKQYVLFDDASFSGNQMTSHLSELSAALAEDRTPRDIYVAIPYVTPVALAKLEGVARPDHIKIHVIHGEVIPTLKMQMEEGSFRHLNSHVEEDFASGEEDSGIATIYFDHKVPNAQSFALSRVARECAPRISPPYGG
jgi:hypothetical protein